MSRHDRFLHALDSPTLVRWAAGLFMAGLFVLLLLLWNDQRNTVAQLDVVVRDHQAQQRKANQDQVRTCFARATNGPAIERALLALTAELKSPKGRRAVEDFRLLNQINTPTYRECRQLAEQLKVPQPRGVR